MTSNIAPPGGVVETVETTVISDSGSGFGAQGGIGGGMYGQQTSGGAFGQQIGGGAFGQQMAASGYGAGAAAFGAAAGAMGVAGGAFGQSVAADMYGAGQGGKIRLEKVEHYPSYNLFSMLDDHPPMAAFRVVPHKLRNY